MEDAKIITLFQNRSEEAIEALKVKYGRRAMAAAINILGNTQDAEEAVSDAVHALWEQIPPEKPAYLWAYFSRILRNICCDRLDHSTAAKRDQRCQVCLEELAECLASPDLPENILESKQITEVINRFLDTLDRSSRIIFVRRYYYFDSCAEIAKQAGMTRGAVNTRLHRLRTQLRDILEKEGIFV